MRFGRRAHLGAAARHLLLLVLLACAALAQEASDVRGKDMHDFFQWALDAPLTQAYGDQLQATLVKLWQNGQGPSLRPLYDQIDNLDMTPAGARAELRRTYRAELLGLDGPLGDLARAINKDARQPMVSGNPPLTRLAVEAFAEWYLFALGYEGPPPGDTFNDSMAVTLQQLYPQLNASQQQSLANVASMWAALRARWPSLSASDQAALKAQWQTLLAPVVAERKPLQPAFQAMQALREAARGDDPAKTAAAAQAVTTEAIKLRGLGTPEALQLATRLEQLVSSADTLAQINSMSAEIADRAHLPISDPDSIQPVVYGNWMSSWAAQDASGLRFRW